jgi:uncharacterized protein (DUF2252 family)
MTNTVVPSAPDLDAAVTRGRKARATVARSSHAEWEPAAGRDPLETLRAEDATRLPELLPIRYGRMAASPMTFFRGAAAVMAADVAGAPATGLRVQLCGDAHLSNFGIFAAPDRRLVFDMNDFDETAPGPWEWDVKRLAASFAVAGRDRGLDDAQRERIVRAVVERYRKATRRFAGMRHVDVWYSRLDVDALLRRAPRLLGRERAEVLARNVEKVRRKDSVRAAARLTEEVDGVVRFRSDPPLLIRIDDLLPAGDAQDLTDVLHGLLAEYARTLPAHTRRLLDAYRPVDLARKVVGVGSVGTRAWVVLLLGRHPRDPLVLQVKEAGASVLEPYAGGMELEHHGQRVVEGQQLLQATSDVLLGWLQATGIDGAQRDFYVRQLWDGKGSASLETMGPEDLLQYGRICGWTLARAHARSGEAAALGAYLGRGEAFDRAIAVFAESYADQNASDHAALVAAIDAGNIPATPGI